MPAVNAIISYCHSNDHGLDRLHVHLAQLQRDGLLNTWTDRLILAGGRLDDEIDKALEASSLFIALVSPDYLASHYCYEKEFTRVREKMEARIVPIILEPCDWLNTPLKNYKSLPKDGRAISTWINENSAFLDVVTGLRRLLETPVSNAIAAAQSPTPISTTAQSGIKRDFDTIDRINFLDDAFKTIQDYFRRSLEELSVVDGVKTDFQPTSKDSFTCSIVNKGRRLHPEAHLTVMKNSSSQRFLGELIVVNERNAPSNGAANGWFHIKDDGFNQYFTDGIDKNKGKLTPTDTAKYLWDSFVKRAEI